MTPPGDEGDEVVQVVPLLGVRSLERRVFDYRVTRPDAGLFRPAERVSLLGALVRIPFGRRQTHGVVVAQGASGERDVAGLRRAALVSATPIPPDLLLLAERLAAYYLAPLGACLQAVVPAHLVPPAQPARGRTAVWVSVNTDRVPGPPEQTGQGGMSGLEDPDRRGHRGESPPDDPGPRFSPTSRQLSVLQAVPPGGIAVAELSRLTGVGRGVVETLVKRGVLHREVRRVTADTTNAGGEDGGDSTRTPDRLGVGEGVQDPPASIRLSDEQTAALSALEAALVSPTAERRLLWGVTGSGKTEVYLGLIRRVLEQGGGAILLVPEIALSGQLVDRLRTGLGRPIAVLHSGLGPQRRAREARALAEGAVRVVVGARSAVFAAVPDLRLIIVDEAHDASYKQEEEPRYDARLVAWWRMRDRGGLVLEGTATPRLESLRAVPSPVRLFQRPTGGSLPEVEVVDMRRQGARGILAPRARAALQETLSMGEQAVVLLNRRGYAGFVRCSECGAVQMCPHCEISLTYHRERGALLCHHCGYQSPPPSVCPECGAGPLDRGSPGTERLRDELLRMVPRSRLFRLDSDVVTSGSRVREVLAAFAASRPAVLLGTQMVAKGHDFPGVTLVVVADADTALYLPDFRSSERTFQLLTQVSGRAGRGDRSGRVLVQTWNPDVPCIRMAVAQKDVEFYAEENALRERLGYPPFRELVRLLTVSVDEERAHQAAEYLAQRLRPHLGADEVRGPARLPRLRRAHRCQILVAARDAPRARELVRAGVERLRVPYARRGVDLVADVDPQWFM